MHNLDHKRALCLVKVETQRPASEFCDFLPRSPLLVDKKIIKHQVQWTTDKLMSQGNQNEHQRIQRSTYPFRNVKTKKAWGSGRE